MEDDNPFAIFTTKSERLELFRHIINAESPLTSDDTDRVLATIKHHASLLEGLSDREIRQIQALARFISVEPWTFPTESTKPPQPQSEFVHASSPETMVVSSPLDEFVSASRKLNFNINLPNQCVSTSSDMCAPLFPDDPYNASSNLPDNLVSLSDFVRNVTTPFSIRNITQFVSPMTCAAFSIPITIPVPSPKPVEAPIPVSTAHDTVPIISVPVSKSSRKGKEKLTVSGTAGKRKIGALEDVTCLSDSKQSKREPTLPPRMTRSRSVSVPVPGPAPTPATASGLSGSKKKQPKKTYHPVLLSQELMHDWRVHATREFILEKSINVEELTEKCNIVPILRDQFLLASLVHIGPYSRWLTAEFYTNLTLDTFSEGSPRFQQVFIRDKWYPLSPAVINSYLGTPNHQAAPDPSPNLLAAALTHNKIVTWPNTGLESLKLTTVYSVLLRIASANWMPAVRHHLVSDQLAALLYKIRNRLPINLGETIFGHLALFVRHREPKVHLPFPSLIFGLLQEHGFKPYTDEVVIANDSIYKYDDRLTNKDHYDDRATLVIIPNVPSATPPVSAPASSADTGSAPVPRPSAVIKEPQTLMDRRQIVLTLQASIAQIRTSVASQQITIDGLEKLLGAELEEIARMEAIYARLRSTTSTAGADTGSVSESDESESGTPSAS
ncbi:PREDICTED: uncharacterized protein LOC109191099 [Ipomoea nil]|uniref:uncharacterized protein LOC109191099 n=1 Tax=Ipomoea nil TaxID=35883 RepID=UPI000900A4D4|nr:PREDICTED: uncharacterized protein LOC109191099 [Ipomoea nil]